jgi:hypothetical protein
VTLSIVINIINTRAFTRGRVNRSSILFIGALELLELSISAYNPALILSLPRVLKVVFIVEME